jgi:hypothetical protein
MNKHNTLWATICAVLFVTMVSMHHNHSAYRSANNSKYVERGTEYERVLADERVANKDLRTILDVLTHGKPLVFTAYNALVNQTDDTPNITASNKQIYGGGLALSREMLVPYGHDGAEIAYGDTVLVMLEMVVEDTMNKRWLSRGDVYMINYAEAVAFGHKKGKLYHYDGSYN